MGLISITTYTDMTIIATPSSGVLIGLDIDGNLKQKDESGNIKAIGTGGTESGTSGSSGSSGVSGTSGINGLDSSNSSRWYLSDNTPPSDPGQGKFNSSNLEFSNITTLSISNYNMYDLDFTDSLKNINTLSESGNVIYLQISDIEDNSKLGVYSISNTQLEIDRLIMNASVIVHNGILEVNRFYNISWVANGINGTSGTSGSGSNGTSGSSGSSGTSGNSGSSGSSGTSGSSGSSGNSGSSGLNGSSGTSGLNGISGTPKVYSLISSVIYSIDSTDSNVEFYPINSKSNAVTINLPDTNLIQNGKLIYIKDVGGSASNNKITIVPDGISKIDGNNNIDILSNYGYIRLIKWADAWWVI